MRDFDWRYWLGFVLLADLSSHAHELFHHLVGRVVCGDWGEVTFWVFSLAPGCAGPKTAIVTAAGPLLTYGLAWLGVALVAPGRYAWGVALIFAQFTWSRLLSSLFTGDERALRRRLLPQRAAAWVIEAGLLLVIALPPLVVAFRTLRRAGALRLIWLYLVAGLIGWSSLLVWNELSARMPLGISDGASRWYFVIIAVELTLVWRWRRRLAGFPTSTPSAARAPRPVA